MNKTDAPPRNLVHDLVAAADAVRRRIDRAVEEASGLSVPQLEFLLHLSGHSDGLPLGKVADGLCCVRSNVTQLADRLEAQGWIERVPDADDRRCVKAVITDQGRARAERGAAARSAAESQITLGIDGADLSRVLDALQAVG